MAKREPDPGLPAVLAKLAPVAAELDKLTTREAVLYDQRARLYVEARNLGASWRDIARAANVTDAAVMRAVSRFGPAEAAS